MHLSGKRILVVGCPGSGKSVFSKKLAKAAGIPLIHLDNIKWRSDRTSISKEEFDQILSKVLEQPEWIIDGNYNRTYEMRIQACDTVIFLDYPEDVSMQGIIGRIGQKRSDIPWVEERVDPELVETVRRFRSQTRPKLMNLLARYPEKEQIVFHSREEADAWLGEEAPKIPTIEILGANRLPYHTRVRYACRAMIFHDDMILMSHETVDDRWMIPGGGMEEGETPEQCCEREVEEETGLKVEACRHFLTIHEYYEDECYISLYYLCLIVGEGKKHLTKGEIERGARPEWISFDEIKEICSHHQDYDGIDEVKRGIYFREYTAFCEYCRQFENMEAFTLADLQPSQFWISEAKLQAVQKWFQPDNLSGFEPIPVRMLDGLPVMTDGHTRAAAAVMAGLDKVPLVWDTDDLNWQMYRRCVAACRKYGVMSPYDLKERVLTEEAYDEKWNSWCDAMQEELKSS